MLGLIAVGCTSLFETVAFFAGSHWSLYEDETIALAKSIDGALDTLPGEYYGIITKIIESYFPWLTLSIVASKIIVPRIEETIQLRKQPKPVANQTDNFAENNAVHRQPDDNTGFVNGNPYRPNSSFR